MSGGMVMRGFKMGIWLAACVIASACGGGDSGVGVAGSGSGSGGTSATGNNVATATVDSGPANNSANTLFVSVTLCSPGTSNCQTIDHVEVDTGSYGLRIVSSALTQSLPVQTTSAGASVVECTNFVQGYAWGPIETADVKIAGETASSMPIQVVGDPNYTTIPQDCSSVGTEVSSVTDFGANGILGVGPYTDDCPECSVQALTAAYYACIGTVCTPTTVATSLQVQNPVASFTTDNNGIIIQMPTVAAGGAATATGSLIFGVDTQANNASNASGTETVLTVDDNAYLSVIFGGTTYDQSFIDSGSNGIYFPDTSLPTCTQSGLTDFYCPTSTTSLSATLEGSNSVTAAFDFDVGNTMTMFTNNTFAAFPDLAGTFPGTTSSFDVGLPFYYGRRVATVIAGNQTSVGTGPYFAF